MSNIILPDDPNFNQPVVMGDPFTVDHTRDLNKQGVTPGTIKQERERQRNNSPGTFKYADSAVVHTPDPLFKQAQQSGVDNMMTQPMWFSPLHTPQNWQIASKRREVYQWNRFWYENEPKVAAAIDFYARFPMNGFSLECPDTKILAFFKHHIVDKLKLNERFKEISSEYYMLGDVFIHTDIDCEICNGIGVDPDTKEVCDHPGGMFKRIFVMNPDWIEVQKSPLTDDPLIVMIPDEELQQIVHKRSPKPIYDRIPEHLKPLIMAKAPIPLSNRTISHLKHMNVPYGTYGTSIIRRLFTTLAYKTKIMTANWIVAERLILPVRVVKIGSDDRPATSTDIADIQTQLAQVANDPNLTIITHHNFEYEWYGTSGKVLQITQEMEHIDKELLDGLMLNQALLNGEMCHDEETEVLTDSGFKKYKNVYTNDKIACYDVYTNKVIYELPLDKHEYDHDGEMIAFNGRYLDILVTPNHKMLTFNRKKEINIKRADEVVMGDRFTTIEEYVHNESVQDTIYLAELDFSVKTEDLMKVIGYYLSEGYTTYREDKYQYYTSISQHSVKNNKYYREIKESMNNMFSSTVVVHEYDCSDPEVKSFTLCNKKIASWFKSNFGRNSYTKLIPQWVKDLHPNHLRTMLKTLVNGDGSRQNFAKSTWNTYSSVSEQLVDDMQEVLFKCGLNSKKEVRPDRFCISWTTGKNGVRPRLKDYHISRKLYKGKVWCFTTSTGFFVTRRNGKITIQGNSGYQSAQVGVETLIRRIESWRQTLAEWCEDRIFKPIAEMQGFVDDEESEKVGEQVFLHPTIKWNDLELKDKTQYHQMLMQLHDKQVISTQTLLDEIGLNYDQEVKRMRYEQAQMGPMGAQMGQGGGDMGGGAMGGMPGGAASPEQGGMGMGMGGDMGGMGMGMGGGMGGDMGAGGGGGGMGGGMAAAGGGGKITKKGKGNKQEDEVVIPMMPIKLTKIEQKMAGMLESVANNMGFNVGEIRMQFPVENPTGGKSYSMDFAIPSLKMDLECLHPNQSVPTTCGSKAARHITEQDELIGRNGDPVKIKRIIKNRACSMLSIKAFGMSPIKVTKNHPILVCKPKKIRVKREEPTITRTRGYIIPDEPEFIKASEISKGDFVLVPKSYSSINMNELEVSKYLSRSRHDIPEKINLTNEIGWLLGIYAAEGSCDERTGKGKVEFSFNMNETEYISRVQHILEDELNIPSRVYTHEDNHCSKVVASSTGLAEIVHDLFGKKASNKRMPSFIFDTSYDFKKSFIQGFWDGDGCVRSYDGAARLVSSSVKMLADIQRLSMSMGHFAALMASREPGTITQIRNIDYVTQGLWELVINFNGHSKAQFREDNKYFYVPVKSISETAYSGEVFNFETSGPSDSNHTYCVGNIVTHNCDGEVWHSSQEQVESDQKRDYLLAQRGWTVLRFDDKAIEESTQQVEATINSYITQAMQSRNGGAKKASAEKNRPHYYISHHGGLKDFKGDGDKYYKYLDATYPSRRTMHRSEVVGNRSKGEYFLTAREV